MIPLYWEALFLFLNILVFGILLGIIMYLILTIIQVMVHKLILMEHGV